MFLFYNRAELIRQRVSRLALKEQPRIEHPEVPLDFAGVHVHVPLPDLNQFNRLLGQGEQSHG